MMGLGFLSREAVEPEEYRATDHEVEDLPMHVGLCARRHGEVRRELKDIRRQVNSLFWLTIGLGLIELFGRDAVRGLLAHQFGITLG